ncbi:MAG: ABC transporter permease [Bacteroidota bacterium]
MSRYLVRRILYSIVVLWGVASLVFFLFNIVPGDPARMVLGQRADSISIAIVQKDLGLDKPVSLQYLKYLNDLSPLSIHDHDNEESYFWLDESLYSPITRLISVGKYSLVLKVPYLRRSYQSRKEISGILRETLPNTLILAITAIVIASVFGLLLGIISALKQNKLTDRLLLLVSTLGMSLPSFFSAILIGWFFAYILGDITGLNMTGNLYEVDDFGEGMKLQLRNLVLPAITLGIRPLSIVLQLSRNSMLDVLSQDYIRTAKSKGAGKFRIIRKHALKNSLNPVITAISGWFASMMAGVVFVEYIYGYKGMGYILVMALNNYDLPLVLGVVLTIAFIFVILNIVVDIIYAYLDPRIHYS